MTTLRIGKLNIVVEPKSFGFNDILVVNDEGDILHVEYDIFRISVRRVIFTEEYDWAVTFAQRYNLLMDMSAEALKKGDLKTWSIIAQWMEDMREE